VSVTIRRATVEDADELARLRWDFRNEAGTPVTTTFDAFVDAFRAFVAAVLARETWWAWLAEDGGRAIGCVWIQLVEKVPHPSRERWERPLAYLTNMYVEEAHRNLGVGRGLVEAAVERAHERGVDGVLLWPSEDSVAFYRRAGFDPTPWLWLHVEGD
jgi:GNAT superfamily N-acetyltransferase